ncbi:unnamed protein product [Porites lobata]|uniref:GB1/RHD3-type G domain-containing protein n=1 Tax=Porites lobata TaxID=104759 RepID=A0ABN8NDN4_9CNID|nr:unnamed protein product [Porites lobata]
MSEHSAVPLCLPNNCKWDEQTGEYSKDEDQDRTKLNVINAALEQLKAIKGPVCVVSIAGPCRKGKSYILSKVFDQGEVFPLGHELDPETMGIWMWIVPEKFQDTSGQEFTVVLLDSEGIDAVSGEGSDDHCIFTLTILLASVLIYNSAGVPTRTDLDGLDYILKLSQRIQIHSGSQGGDAQRGVGTIEDAKLFHKTFPFFIWLLRDVVLALPKGCPNIKDYFLTKVFKTSASSKPDKAKDVAESILSYFPGFDAFKLPPPSSDPEVVLNLNRDEVQQDINKSFVRGVEEFKANLKSKLAPKLSFSEGEIVTGEALATMVTSYVTALNTPGMVPNIQKAWDVFVTAKCTQAKSESITVYDETMESEMSGRMPCERDVIRQAQMVALDKALKLFEEKTYGISTGNMEKYLHELTDYMENGLNNWQKENARLTKESCNQLLVGLKRQHLDPVLTQLRGKDGAKVSFAEIMACYSAIEQGFKLEAKGAEDVCAQVFFEFHPELQGEMENHMEHLQQLKDFDENLAYEKEARAHEMQEKKRLEEERARLAEEQAMKERELETLKAKQEEEKRRLEEQLRSGMEAQRRQMDNMIRANMEELQRERESVMAQNKTLQQSIEGMQRSLNERNGEITNLQRQIQEIANRPPPQPPKKKRRCVIM